MRCQKQRQLQSQHKQISIIKLIHAPRRKSALPAHLPAHLHNCPIWRSWRFALWRQEKGKRQRKMSTKLSLELSWWSCNCVFYLITNSCHRDARASSGQAEGEQELVPDAYWERFRTLFTRWYYIVSVLYTYYHNKCRLRRISLYNSGVLL